MNSDRNLLFGILALQNDFVSREQLVAAMNEWVLEKQTPLGQILRRRGFLDEDEHELLDALVKKQLANHAGNMEASIAALSSVNTVCSALEQVDDDQVRSLASVLRTHVNDFPGTVPFFDKPIDQRGRFTIVRPHAAGGLGEVFVAKDNELDREVALKQIKEQYSANSQQQSRFKLEAELTGGLEHPGIVPIYSLGSYADGRPFYAMRFIRGDSLKEAIDRFHRRVTEGRSASSFASLEFRGLLRRFVDVCNAIAYAHSRGVLHRDLKPGNIMLGKFGETLVVDWGLAKALGKPVSADQGASLGALVPPSASGSGFDATAPGSAIGTPAYMSPEQADGRLDELGPATDVYSLGATLYTVLTGKPPFSGKSLVEILAKVQTGDFTRPQQLQPAAPKALEAVCIKAMALQPAGRYATALELANDLEHWLADESVSAWREPVWIRAKRWVRKRPALATGLAVGLLVGIISLSIGFLLVSRAYERERDAKMLARENEKRAKAETSRANAAVEAETKALELTQRRLAQIEKGVELFAEVLRGVNPSNELLGGPTVFQQLRAKAELAADQLVGESIGEPLSVARLQTILGGTLVELGNAEKAEQLLKKAVATRERLLGPENSETLDSLASLGLALTATGKLPESIALHARVRKVVEAKGPGNQSVIWIAKKNLAVAYQKAGRLAEAIGLLEEIRDAQAKSIGPEHPRTLTVLGNLATTYLLAGNATKAIEVLEPLAEKFQTSIGPGHPDTLKTMNNLAAAYDAAGKLTKSIALYEKIRDRLREKLGVDHPATLTACSNLGAAYSSAGKKLEAIALLEQVRDIEINRFGPEHPDLLNTLNNLALAYLEIGKLQPAIKLLEQVRDAKIKKLGFNHPDTLTTLGNLASAYHDAKDPQKAIALMERIADVQRKTLAADHPISLTTMDNLAAAYRDVGNLQKSISLYEGVLAGRKRNLGADHPNTLNTTANLANVYQAAGRSADSIRLYELVFQTRSQKQGLDHPATQTTMGNLGKAYCAAGKGEQAADILGKFIALRRKRAPKDDPGFALLLYRVALDLMKCGQCVAAEGSLRECLAIRQKKEPDKPTTFETMSLLGAALAGQAERAADAHGKVLLLAESETLLLNGYKGMKLRLEKPPLSQGVKLKSTGSDAVLRQRQAESADRLAQFYQKAGRSDEATRWRREADAIRSELRP